MRGKIYGPGLDERGDRIAVSNGDLCLFVSLRIGTGRRLLAFQNLIRTLLPLTPRLVHLRLDFTRQYERDDELVDVMNSPPALQTLLFALQFASQTLRVLEVLFGCPSDPYGLYRWLQPSRFESPVSLPNLRHLYVDTDDELVIFDLLARCPNLRSLRLSCAYGAVQYLTDAVPNLEELALNVDPHPLVRYAAHLPVNWSR